MAFRSSLMMSAIDRQDQPVGVGLVGIDLLAQRALLDLAAGLTCSYWSLPIRR